MSAVIGRLRVDLGINSSAAFKRRAMRRADRSPICRQEALALGSKANSSAEVRP
jgi:hypothetical protein